MSRSIRLFDLIQILRDGRLHRASDMARDLGVSVRSIWRDMATLSASGMPVEGERGVGYILRQPITLPPMMLQPTELIALRLGVRLVAEGADPNLAAAARSLAGKIATVAPAPREPGLGGSGLGEDLFTPSPTPAHRASPHLPMLRKAIRQSERLTIAVLDGAGQLTQRDIRPLALALTGQTWVLAAWCDTKTGFAAFGMDRLLDIVPRGEAFPREAGKRLTDYRKWQAQGAGQAAHLEI
jgi:predicted DNA-binding transcriptional regulator YafY